MKFIFYSPIALEQWDFRNLDKYGIGGSETSHIEMSWRLASRGHEVISYANIPDDCPKEYRGVKWFKLEEADFTQEGIWVIYRCPETLDKFEVNHPNQTIWFVSQDAVYVTFTKERADKMDKVLPLCIAHRNHLARIYPFIADKLMLTSNGIRMDVIRSLDKEELPVRNPKRLMWASSPDRGLKQLLPIFKRAREFIPELELHICYGFDNIDKMIKLGDKFNSYQKLREEIFELIKQPNVFYYGRIPQKELYKEWLKTGIWCHPTMFTETSCITCMEAQALGAIPITNPIWALRDNVRHGIFIEGDLNDRLTQARYVGEIIRLASNTELQENIRKTMVLSIRMQFNWDIFVDQWENELLGIKGNIVCQWNFQRKHAKGKILNIGSDGDRAHFHSVGAVNVDVNEKHPVFGYDNKADVIADIRALPESLYNKFDSVIVGEILEHLSYQDGVLALKNAKATLSDGGKVIITCPQDDRGQTEDIYGAEVKDYTKGSSGVHRYISKEELRGMVQEVGMKIDLEQRIDYAYFEGVGLVCS